MRVITELLRWCLGAALLLIIDVFEEAVVFEWLKWNSTPQNDWFFLLGWLMVAGWTVSSARLIWRAMSNKPE